MGTGEGGRTGARWERKSLRAKGPECTSMYMEQELGCPSVSLNKDALRSLDTITGRGWTHGYVSWFVSFSKQFFLINCLFLMG